MKTIALASDHAGYELKEQLKAFLRSAHPRLDPESPHEIPHQARDVQYEILDLGTNSAEPVDYPDFGKAAAESVAGGKAELGVVICGSGIGISIAANRNPKVRCALCINVEMAKMARRHNDANVLALGARITSSAEAEKILKTFLETEFEGGRHIKRVEKLGNSL